MTTLNSKLWFVLRDLKRANAKLPAHKFLSELSFEVFTPLRCQISVKRGKRTREEVPVIRDLLFVHATREELDPIFEKNPTIQYCYKKGSYRNPMTVDESDMARFVHAFQSSSTPKFYQPGELTPAMYGRKVRIIGGPLNNYTGHLLALRGSGKKRLIVELSDYLSIGVEVDPEYIELVQE